MTSDVKFGGSGRSCSHHAQVMGTASFMISEGWKRMKPRSSQRCAPLPMWPVMSTTISRMHAEHPQRQREPAQERGLHLRERAHREAAERGADGAVDHAVPVLARGAVEHDEAIERDEPEADEQRAVELERAENAARGAEGAAGCGSRLRSVRTLTHSSPGASGSDDDARRRLITGGGMSGVVVLPRRN